MTKHPYNTDQLDYEVMHYRMTKLRNDLSKHDMVLAEAARGLEACRYAQDCRQIQASKISN